MMTIKNEGRRQDENGAVLIMVLVVMTVIGLVVGALLVQSDASLASPRVVRAHQAKVYSADAGIDYAVQSLKRDTTICPDSTTDYDFSNVPTFNAGTSVAIHCHTVVGSSIGIRGYAVVVLGAGN